MWSNLCLDRCARPHSHSCLQLCHVTVICPCFYKSRVSLGRLLPNQQQPTMLTTAVVCWTSFLCHFSDNGVRWCQKAFDHSALKRSRLPRKFSARSSYPQIDLWLCQCDWNPTVVVHFKEFEVYLLWFLAHLFIFKHCKWTCYTGWTADVWGLELVVRPFWLHLNREGMQKHLCTLPLMYRKQS